MVEIKEAARPQYDMPNLGSLESGDAHILEWFCGCGNG